MVYLGQAGPSQLLLYTDSKGKGQVGAKGPMGVAQVGWVTSQGSLWFPLLRVSGRRDGAPPLLPWVLPFLNSPVPKCAFPPPHRPSPALWEWPPHRPPISGAVLVDGQDVALPWSAAGGLSVSRASSSFLLLRWPGAHILWGVSDAAAYITLDPRHAHQVCPGGG